MKRILIIDDEINAREAIRTLLKDYCQDVEIIGEYTGVAAGVQGIRELKPDVVLLDISMEDGTGFDLLDFFPRADFRIIFITAHDEFALRAFKYNALDYLLKPIFPKDLVAALDRVQGEQRGEHQQKLDEFQKIRHYSQVEKIALYTQEGLNFIRLDQILYLEADSNYTTFYLQGGDRLVVSRPLKEFEEILSEDCFFRLHQSYIVNLEFVEKVLKEDGGYAFLSPDIRIPIARRRKEEFLRALGQ